jgi:hypothetical protein
MAIARLGSALPVWFPQRMRVGRFRHFLTAEWRLANQTQWAGVNHKTAHSADGQKYGQFPDKMGKW